MASIHVPTPRFTVKEYLALEGVAETKHEYTGGDIVAMAGAELDHNQIAQNVRSELAAHLGKGSCRILSADQRVLVESIQEYFYPDVLVTCLEPVLVDPRPRSLNNPQVIIEVLSESTAGYDRGVKWFAYRAIPTLTDYVMVSSLRREVEHYRRGTDGTWTQQMITSGACTLTAGVRLDLTELYRLTTLG